LFIFVQSHVNQMLQKELEKGKAVVGRNLNLFENPKGAAFSEEHKEILEQNCFKVGPLEL